MSHPLQTVDWFSEWPQFRRPNLAKLTLNTNSDFRRIRAFGSRTPADVTASSTSRLSEALLTNLIAPSAVSDVTPQTASVDVASAAASVALAASMPTLMQVSAFEPHVGRHCDFSRLHSAAVGVRARRRHHLVPWGSFNLIFMSDARIGVAS